MPEWLLHYAPTLLAWLLFTTRRGGDPGRRAVRQVFLGLAVSLTALTPAGHAVIRAVTGAPDLPRLVGHAGMLYAAWSAQRLLAHLNGIRPPRAQGWWIGGMFAVMCVLFALMPDLKPQSPWVMEYCFAYAAAQIPAFVGVIRLGLRYTRLASLRTGLYLAVAGTAAGIGYLVNKTVLAAAPRWGFEYPLGHAFLMSKALPAAAHLLVLVGVTLPGAVAWLGRWLRYRRLRPLWTALYRADPAIALDPRRLVPWGLRMRLYRRVIEIRDGLLALQPYRDPAVAVAARESGIRDGLRGRRLDAAVEAAAVAAALSARADGVVPGAAESIGPGGEDLDSDTAFLSEVAVAYRRGAVAVR
ncbi:MAB_1171c family putative transporter [Amycolatopsis sp. NBC_01480]|uniref:MAB_1171c family putative transporter n=1 Tax=Amycolatopsis sp. NBC_01480 TaxID=2903562 RepID=UPI002E2B6F81|nr:MAB_1171c family putative transporter [Amycolatopsis sp. NBC_01480]